MREHALGRINEADHELCRYGAKILNRAELLFQRTITPQTAQRLNPLPMAHHMIKRRKRTAEAVLSPQARCIAVNWHS